MALYCRILKNVLNLEQKKLIDNNIINYLKKHDIVIVLIFVLASLCFKLIYFQWNIPLTLDSLGYFFYASDIKIIEKLPDNYNLGNMGWSLFLSIIFKIFSFENTYYYMEVQKLTSIVLSSLTVIPIFYLCKKFFPLKFCIIGAMFFAFEPRILENSFLGSSDQFFVLCSASAITLYLSKNKKLILLSFVFAGIATVIRAEGLMLFFSFSLLYFIRFRNYKKLILQYLLNLLVFFIILLPVLSYQHDITNNDMIFGRLTNTISYHTTEHLNQKSPTGIPFILSGLENFPKYFGWILIPIFIPYFLLGFYYFLKKFNLDKLMILIIGVFIALPLFYIYSIHIQETRYLFSLFPLICIISLYSIQKIDERFKKTIIFVVIASLILISSISYLELKSKIQYQDEAYQISLFVNQNSKVINEFYPISNYLEPIDIPTNYTKFKDLFFESRIDGIQTRSHITRTIQVIPTEGVNSLEKFILSKRHEGLTHVIVQENDQRIFLLDVYNNEHRYPYLKKIMDTSLTYEKYKVKIFEINYKLFDKELSNFN